MLFRSQEIVPRTVQHTGYNEDLAKQPLQSRCMSAFCGSQRLGLILEESLQRNNDAVMKDRTGASSRGT